MTSYIWQYPDWPNVFWESAKLLKPLGACRLRQGRLLAQARGLGFAAARKASAEAMAREAVTTSAIEGVRLDPESVRSSVARRLGLPDAGLGLADRSVEGLVDVLFDAVQGRDAPLDAERLFGWRAALFPTGYSGLKKIHVAGWREADLPMRVLSGPVGREKTRFVAPPGERVPKEMERFFAWWERSRGEMDGVLRAGVAHLLFVTIHPFEDGNGRIARALTDMAMARDEREELRCYSLSAQISRERQAYYDVLERTQKGSLDITAWLQWFLGCFSRAMDAAEQSIELALRTSRYWSRIAGIRLNDRQRKALQALVEAGPEGFEGGLGNRNYRGLTKTSQSTAARDLAELTQLGLLRTVGAGRSLRYELVWEDED